MTRKNWSRQCSTCSSPWNGVDHDPRPIVGPMIKNIEFPENALRWNMTITRSKFGVRRRLRALYWATEPHARNAPKTSRYSGLQGPIWRYFCPQSPLKYLRLPHSRVVFRNKRSVWGEYFWHNPVGDLCEGTNIVYGKRIEPPFVEIGPKLISVDQKVVTVIMWKLLIICYNI